MLTRGAVAQHLERRRVGRFAKACRVMCQLHRWKLVRRGRLPSKPVIYVCNHLGYVDPIVVCALADCCPIAKQEVASWPVLGPMARSFGVLFVERNNAYSGMRALRAAKRKLEAGVSVLNFPEGTTTTGATLPFLRGIFGLAKLANVPVVPLALAFERKDLSWVGDDSLVPHYFRHTFARSNSISVDVGPAIHIRPEDSPEIIALVAHAWIANSLRTTAKAATNGQKLVDSKLALQGSATACLR